MDKLVSEIQRVFEDDVIDVGAVEAILQDYKSDRRDWQPYAIFDAYKYTRNLVDNGNGKYNLLILCWGPGMGSSIHDHTGSHCFVKVLSGSLTETKFAYPSLDKPEPLALIDSHTHTVNEVTYISDKIGLHRMENPSQMDGTVTLHLYIPPYDKCRIFDEKTGRNALSVVTFFTKHGKKVSLRSRSKERENQLVARSDHSFV